MADSKSIASRDSSACSGFLLCGVGPLPSGDSERLFAPGLRIWSFARALHSAGHQVDILEVGFGKSLGHCTGRVYNVFASVANANGVLGNLDLRLIAEHSGTAAEIVSAQLRKGRYQGVVSSTDVMNRACAETSGDLPLWLDFNGHPMAERQAMAFVFDCDEGLIGQWDYVIPSLLRGDRFSTCSSAQRLALIGELGSVGRLGRWNEGDDLVFPVPPVPVFTEFAPSSTHIVRGKVVPEDAFIVLWSGGYNTWADPITLGHGIISAMERNPRIHYVSTGGAIAGHDERTFGRFREIVDNAPCADRFHFVGWVPLRDMSAFYTESDVAVCCDRRGLEVELGHRNRIQEWVCARLPVASTDLCELTHELAVRNLMDAFQPGDDIALAECILRLAGEPIENRRERTERAREWVLERYSPENVFRPLIEWASRPYRANDLIQDSTQVPGVPFRIPNNSLAIRSATGWRDAHKPRNWTSRLLTRLGLR
jgi:glycosyltransferase involved in cell wall biosynthesis